MLSLRRRIIGDVHDRRPKEVLRCHEENGQQETCQGDSTTKGMVCYLQRTWMRCWTMWSWFQWKPQAIVFGIVTNKKFDMIIMLFIGLNMLTMTLDHYHQSEMWSFALDNLNLGFIVIFTSECVLKIFALRLYYFKEPWNMFDFIVVILSILGKQKSQNCARHQITANIITLI